MQAVATSPSGAINLPEQFDFQFIWIEPQHLGTIQSTGDEQPVGIDRGRRDGIDPASIMLPCVPPQERSRTRIQSRNAGARPADQNPTPRLLHN